MQNKMMAQHFELTQDLKDSTAVATKGK